MMVMLVDDRGHPMWVNPAHVSAAWAAAPDQTYLMIAGFDGGQTVKGSPTDIVARLFPQPDVI